jgi:hypothetical protein
VSSHQKDDLLRKISGLLAKAEQTEFEGERQVFMEKADELMARYQIELWELAQTGKRVDQRQPVIRDFDYDWAFSNGPFPEICDSLWSLFVDVARHTNCSIVYHKQHFSGEKQEYKGYVVPVIGTEADLGYLTLLFTSLMTQLIEATHPRVDKSKSYHENLRMFREAGWGWLEVAKVMQAAGYDTDMPAGKPAADKMTRAYRSYCKKMGIEQNYAHFKTYRRNFAYGFASRVGGRLAEMRQHTETAVGTGMELVLVDQRKRNAEFMDEMFGQPTNRRSRALSTDTRRFDSAAFSGGQRAGNQANISVNPGKGLGSTKSLGK